MITHYALFNTADLSNYFSLPDGLPKGIKPSYNYSPTIGAPIIVNENGKRVAKLMKWGLVAQGAKDTNSVFRYKTYNIASEKIFSRHSWELAVRERRCLVPADGFYELNESGKKRAFYVHSKDKKPLTFAGVYSSWEDPAGVTHGTFSVITIEANHDLPAPGTRMPIIISPENHDRWLDASVNDLSSLYDMLRAYPSDRLAGFEVSPAVHSPKADDATMITRL